jgi:hypothetical protein
MTRWFSSFHWLSSFRQFSFVHLFGFLGYFVCISIIGCQSTGLYTESKVISNIDDSLKTPSWANGSIPFYMDNSDIVYVNVVSMEGGSRSDACLRAAQMNASAEMMKSVKIALTVSGQVEELSASADPAVSSLTAYLSQGTLSGARVVARYWEYRIEPDASGRNGIKRLRCAVKVSIPKDILEKQMRAAIEKSPEGNPEIRQKLLNAQKQFIDSVSATPAP